METTRVAMLMTVMVMGNLLAETEAQEISFAQCYPLCIAECKNETKFPKVMLCPFTCFKTCLHPMTPPTSPDMTPPTSPELFEKANIDQTHDFCKFHCAVNHCASLTSTENPNVEKVACVDTCSKKCSNKI